MDSTSLEACTASLEADGALSSCIDLHSTSLEACRASLEAEGAHSFDTRSDSTPLEARKASLEADGALASGHEALFLQFTKLCSALWQPAHT